VLAVAAPSIARPEESQKQQVSDVRAAVLFLGRQQGTWQQRAVPILICVRLGSRAGMQQHLHDMYVALSWLSGATYA
jgi:hypothetical protein